MTTIEESRNDSAMIYETPEVDPEKLIGIDDDSENDNCKERVDGPKDNMHYCGEIISLPLVEKKEDLVAFTIPCFIGPFNVR